MLTDKGSECLVVIRFDEETVFAWQGTKFDESLRLGRE
jgi:hypothetical protein